MTEDNYYWLFPLLIAFVSFLAMLGETEESMIILLGLISLVGIGVTVWILRK